MAEITVSTGTSYFDMYVDPLLESILRAEMIAERFFGYGLSLVDRTFRQVAMDWKTAQSLLKGFVTGGVVIFLMCFLDWQAKRR